MGDQMLHISKWPRLICCAAAILTSYIAKPVQAQGDLLVAPTRVVVNGAGNAEVVLSNIGEKPATYRISLELRRMDESGDFANIAEADATPEERAALEMVRYSPRRVTLLPGQPQAVRLSVRPPEGLPDGEYRVHMGFRAIPDPVSTESGTASEEAASAVSIKLTPIYGITIPVFLRKGRLDAKAGIEAVKLVRLGGRDFVQVSMSRSGNRSVYGELIGKTARGETLFSMRGIAIYPEVSRRDVHVPLGPEQMAMAKGPVQLEYRELPENGGAVLAQATVTLP